MTQSILKHLRSERAQLAAQRSRSSWNQLVGIHLVIFEAHGLDVLTGVCLQLFSKHRFR